MYDEEEPRRFVDVSRLEPIVEHHDEEMLVSSSSSVSPHGSYLDDERRAREEIRQFEQLEKECATAHRRGVRVKFDDDSDRLPAPTMIVRTEPCFQVNACEDQVTKHFFENEYQWKAERHGQAVPKTPSEPDSLDDELLISFEMDRSPSYPRPLFNAGRDDRTVPSPTKSILKKTPATQDRIPVPQSNPAVRSRSPSPAAPKKRTTSSTHSESNEVEFLASVTAKETVSTPCPASRRSLFEPTINIFEPSNGVTRRPSRLRYYIKPYRGETYIRPSAYREPEQRAPQGAEPVVWYTFSNQYSRPVNRRQHVSWSPVREYIHRGREKPVGTLMKKKEPFLSPMAPRSSSNPCLRSASPSMIPIPVRYRPLQAAPTDFYETASMSNYSLTPNSQPDDPSEIRFSSPLVSRANATDTMQRYERLLEKMRDTDEQLKLLSQSWKNSTVPKAPVGTHDASDRSISPLPKATSSKALISPAFLQICLLVLVIFNLLVVYYFNEINIIWNGLASDEEEDVSY